MSNILHITASISGDNSVTGKLSTRLVKVLAKSSGASVTHRDLASNPPPFIDGARFAANGTPEAERTPEQEQLAEIGNVLIAEMQAADTIVMGVPVHNFTMPSTLKAWADLVARAGSTFAYTDTGPVGLLTGKKVYLVVASGGTIMGSEIDFLSPWLLHFLRFIGLDDVELIAADGRMSKDGPEKIAAAEARIDALGG